MVDAVLPDKRDVLASFNTPIFNIDGINFRINDRFVNQNKKDKKAKLNNKVKLVEGDQSESIKNSREYVNYNPIKLNNDLIVVNDKTINDQVSNPISKDVPKNKLEELEKQYNETLKLQQEVLTQIKALKGSRGDKTKGIKKIKKSKDIKNNQDKGSKDDKTKKSMPQPVIHPNNKSTNANNENESKHDSKNKLSDGEINEESIDNENIRLNNNLEESEASTDRKSVV